MRRTLTLLLIPLSLTLVGATPGVSEFERLLAEAEHHVRHAAAVGRAASGMQNELARRLELGGAVCEDATVRALLARSRHLGHAYRDAAQAGRVRAERVDRLRQLATVAPLLTDDVGQRAEAVVKAGRDEVQRYRTTAGWQSQLLEPDLRGCRAPLDAGPGLAHELGSDQPVAVVGLGGGRVCPADETAEGAVIVVDGYACWAQEGCDCTPGPVGPGAVLGPTVPSLDRDARPLKIELILPTELPFVGPIAPGVQLPQGVPPGTPLPPGMAPAGGPQLPPGVDPEARHPSPIPDPEARPGAGPLDPATTIPTSPLVPQPPPPAVPTPELPTPTPPPERPPPIPTVLPPPPILPSPPPLPTPEPMPSTRTYDVPPPPPVPSPPPQPYTTPVPQPPPTSPPPAPLPAVTPWPAPPPPPTVPDPTPQPSPAPLPPSVRPP